MAHHLIFILSSSLLMALLAFQGTQAVQYEVANDVGETPGGTRFNNEIGVDYSKQILESASNFAWQIFRQPTDADRKDVPILKMFVDTTPPAGIIAQAIDNEIHVSANFIADASGDVKSVLTGVLYHEVAHVWQWFGNGQALESMSRRLLVEGIADYVRLKANYIPSHWVKPGGGERWDQGYDVTARFLEYCNSLKDGFVAELNGKMRTGYSENFFEQLLGKPVDQLWSDYKIAFGGERVGVWVPDLSFSSFLRTSFFFNFFSFSFLSLFSSYL